MSDFKTQEIVELSMGVGRMLAEFEKLKQQPRVTSIRPHVREPLEHVYRQLEAAKLALDAASYAVAHAYLMNSEGRE